MESKKVLFVEFVLNSPPTRIASVLEIVPEAKPSHRSVGIEVSEIFATHKMKLVIGNLPLGLHNYKKQD